MLASSASFPCPFRLPRSTSRAVQVNEVFLDETTAACPISIPAHLLSTAPPRRVSFSLSVVSLCRGLNLAQARHLICFTPVSLHAAAVVSLCFGSGVRC